MAKHERQLSANTTEPSLAKLIQRPGKTPDDDEFLEVHIYGPLSAQSLEQAVVRRLGPHAESRLKVLREQLGKLSVPLEET